ncbi:MAG: NAD-binding protein [Betaproteobacteria bacterium]|jgi:voltage-gated potassium channel Kch|nr:NAD-binding protein [Betaproteobacteria bacterium]
MTSVLFLALRRLRLPIILLIAVYSIGVIGLVLIPGVDAQGRTWQMSFFHAFYFLSYTASTIGFGELPRPFSDAQRLWVTGIIYLSVVGWAYFLGSLLALVQDRGFRLALVTQRFEREVRGLSESFYVVCGYGETGSLICRALDRMGLQFVVLDIDGTRIDEVDLQGYARDTPAIVGDARVVENLVRAGITHRACRGVMAITSDDQANLAVAIAVKLLNPRTPVLCRAMSRDVAKNMASFGTDHIINPFQRFGEHLWLALHAPAVYRLISRLTGLPGTTLTAETTPPHGHWIVCGYGRFGREVIGCFDREGLEATVIDPEPQTEVGRRVVRGYGTEGGPLREAGVETAVGIVAGTDNDVNNLSIAVTAREINPKLFVVLRQNLEANRPLFGAFSADITMVSAEIVAYQSLSIVATPLLARFLGMAGTQDEPWASLLVARLEEVAGPVVAATWGVDINAAAAPAIHRVLMFEKNDVTLDALLRDPTLRVREIACVPLLLVRDGAEVLMPDAKTPLKAGDRLLFAGTNAARDLQRMTLRNVHARDYVILGRDRPAGWIWQWLSRRNDDAASTAGR